MKGRFGKLMILFVVLALCAPAQSDEPINVVNPSFESGTTGWTGATTDNSEYYASPDGESYATRSGGAGYTSQMTGHTITAGETYKLTVWARSINAAANSAATNVEAQLYYGSTTITSVTQDVYPVALSGPPATIHNDDGGNVWLDGNYRMSTAQTIFYQTIDKDPINDPWSDAGEPGNDCGLAPIMTPQGLNAIYGCGGYSEDPPYSAQVFGIFTGDPPFYNHSELSEPILEHSGDEDPWVIDSHLYYDYATSRLWMTWGGGTAYVSELDPFDGELIDHPPDPEFDTHPSWYHTAVVLWSGDEWTGTNTWMEGPSLYKHGGYWYMFSTCGNMDINYSIRMGRGTSPTGPFYDKDGVGMTEYDSGEDEYGNSFLVGDEGEFLVPGHPHLWEENGIFYMGYDYRPNSTSEPDIMGIRRLYWVNDWPTIWTPITVTFNADDYPAAIGQTLGISLRNTGSGSNAAFDYVSLVKVTPDYDPPTPDPMTWASVPTADDQDSISMTATTASDPAGVSYYFDETSGNPGGSDSGWQSNPSYNDGDLSPETEYTYTVTARDNSANQNETAASTAKSATTEVALVFKDNFESSMNWINNWTAYGEWQRVTANPYEGNWSAEIDGDVTDSALVSAAIDVIGKASATITFAWLIERSLDSGEYLRFDVDTGSGWVQMASLDGNVDTEDVWHNVSIPDVDVSTASSMYIRFRGKMSGGNEDAYVDGVEVTAAAGVPDTDPPTPDPMTWVSVPTADEELSISMTATTATDPSGVQYYFDETTGNPGGSDSGWQSDTSYTNYGLNPETEYTYTVTARDNSANQNETDPSTAESATTPPFTSCPGGYYTDYIGAGHDTDVVATVSLGDGQLTVDGSGLVGDEHSTEWDDGWIHYGQPPVPAPSPNPARGDGFWIHYDLGYLYTLADMWVWNSNESCCTDRGFKDLVIDYSFNGSTWIELGTFQWPEASGSDNYTGFAGPDFGDVCARYVLITAITNWGSPGAYGLAEVKINVVDACTATDCHIESVVCSEQSCGGPNDNGVATVTIYDDCGDPVQNALVDGTFSGDFNETFYDVQTDENGDAVFTTAGCIKKPSFSFTVDDVDHGTLPHDPGDDLATGCSG